MKCKNKEVKVDGLVQTKAGVILPAKVRCIITNDKVGKTLSVGNDSFQFTIPFEPIEKYLK